MSADGVQHKWLRADLAGAALLVFAALGSARALFRATPSHESFPVYAASAALLVGGVLAALVVRRVVGSSDEAGRYGGGLAAVFAIEVGSSLLVVRPGLLEDLTPRLALAIGAVTWLTAGIALGWIVGSHASHSGHVIGACVVGGGAAEALAATGTPAAIGPAALALVIGGAAAVGALLVAWPRGVPTAAALGATALALSGAAVALERAGIALPWMAPSEPWWSIGADEATILRRAIVWGSGATAVLGSSFALQGLDRRRQSGLARLHVVAMLWGAGGVLLCAPALEAIGGRGEAPIVLAAVGAAVGAVAIGAWSVTHRSLSRAFVSGAIALALAVAVSHWLGTAGERPSSLQWAAGLLAIGIPLGAIPVVGMSARIALLVGPTHALWVWGCAGLAAAAAIGYGPAGVRQEVAAAWVERVAILMAAASWLVAAEVRLWMDSARRALRWVLGEWSAKQVRLAQTPVTREARSYPLALHLLKFLTYIGYIPWWVLSMVVRAAAASVSAIVATAVRIVTGMVAGALELVLGKDTQRSARRIVLERGAPVVELSPEEAPQVEEAEEEEEEGRAGGFEIGRIAFLPILLLAKCVERGLLAVDSLLQRLPGWREQDEEDLPVGAQEAGQTETVVIGPAPSIVPGFDVTLEAVRTEVLALRVDDPKWRRWLRRTLGFLKSPAIREKLGPDTAESWDDRVFRAEMVGPRGRRLELFGHLWMSRRRRGCVVTIPVLSGNVHKGVDLYAGHREVRDLVKNDAETLKRMLLRAAYRLAVRDMTAGLQASRTVVCESPRDDLIEPNQDRYCELREEVPGGGRRCRVPMQQDQTRGATTLAACAECDYPEIWQRCRNLRLRGTIGVVDDQSILHRRAHMICGLERVRPPVEECPRRECFSPTMITRVAELDSARTR